MTARRGTTNRNDRGSSEDRRRRREWLVNVFRADVDIRVMKLDPPVRLPGFTLENSEVTFERPAVSLMPIEVDGWRIACRCYRCGTLLTMDTVTVDRIIPGCQGGTYRRNNIRPACGTCNSETGGSQRSKAR